MLDAYVAYQVLPRDRYNERKRGKIYEKNDFIYVIINSIFTASELLSSSRINRDQ